MLHRDWKRGVFCNLDPKHGFGVDFREIRAKLPGLVIDHVDLHAVPYVDGQPPGTDVIAEWKKSLADQRLAVQTLWVGFQNDKYGTIADTHGNGLVPVGTRDSNAKIFREGMHLAGLLGAQAVGTHFGHIESLGATGYSNLVALAKEFCAECKLPGGIVLETGQESAGALLAFLDAVDRAGNKLGINFDPANMILYGSDDPVEALRKVAHRVRSLHAKDATWTTGERGVNWGDAAKLGAGDVGGEDHFDALLDVFGSGTATRRLPLTVEYEPMDGSHGSDQHWAIIRAALNYLVSLDSH